MLRSYSFFRPLLCCIFLIFLTHRGQAQDAMKLYQEALTLMDQDERPAYRAAIALLDTLAADYPLSDSLRLEVVRKAGVCYYYLDEERQAIEKWETALQLSEEHFGVVHAKNANLLYNLASAHKYLFEDEQARIYFERSLAMYDQLPVADSLGLADKYVEVADFLLEKADLYQAQIYSERALLLTQPSDKAIRANVYRELGVIKVEMQNYAEGLADLLQAVDYYGETAEASVELHNIYQNIGRTYGVMNELELATTYVQRGLKMADELEWIEGRITDNSVLAAIRKRQGRFSEALGLYEEQLVLKQQHYNKSNHPTIAAEYENIGELYLEMGELDRARDYFNRAISILMPAWSGDAVEQIAIQRTFISDRNDLIRLFGLQSRLYQKIFENTGDLSWLENAHRIDLKTDSLIVLLRQRFLATDSKFSQIARSLQIYERAIANAHQLFLQTNNQQYLDNAYRFVARNKAIILLEGIRTQRTQKQLPEAIQQQSAALDADLRATTLAIQKAEINQLSVRDSLYSAYFEQVRAKERLLDEIARTYPQYYNDNYAFLRPPDFTEIRSSLQAGQGLLEYFYGVDELFIFFIDQDTTLFLRQPKTQDLDQDFIAFRQNLEQNQVDFTDLSFQLYQQLFPEALVAHLQAHAEIDHLIVVPDNVLHQVPFEALKYQNDGQAAGLKGYLLENYMLSYVYSTRLLTDAPSATLASSVAPFYGVGLAYDEMTLGRLDEEGWNGQSLSRLQFSEEETLRSAALFDGQTRLGAAATLAHFVGEAGAAQILHLSMHALMNEQFPEQTALVFHGGKAKDPFLLRSLEIYNLDLQADLVVLSACNTAAGKLSKGEGIRSLARSFAYAGCPSIVASQWPAAEKSTRDILLSFYQNLQAGMSKAAALRAAKQDYLAAAPPSQALPAYWSNFILIGDPNAMELTAARSWQWAWWLGGLGVLLLITVWRRRAKS